jgi:hypothetical protein
LSSTTPPFAVATVGGDDELGLGVVHAIGERFGAEATEDDAMRGADPGAGQHRHDGFGNERHVDADPVAGDDAEMTHDVGAAAHLTQQIAVGERALVARLTLPDDRRLVAPPRKNLAIDAVVGEVRLAADEPFAHGKFHSRTRSQRRNQCSASAASPQNASGSSTERRYIAS